MSALLIISLFSGIMAYLPLAGEGAPDTWTIMAYMNADNDLEPYGIEDFLEMSAAGSSPEVNIVVQFDRIVGHDWTFGAWNTCKRFLVTQGMTPTAANASSDIGEVNMADPATLTDFIDWAVGTYDTNHYVLVIWDHGSNWQGVSWDYSTPGYDYMDMGELDTALAGAVALNPGLMLDVIAFDACSLGSLEVAYQVMPYARYMIASEIDVPNPGLEYTGPLSALVADPDMGVTEFSDEILAHYSEYYLSLAGTPRWNMLNGSFTLSLVDLQLVGSLAASVDELSTVLVSDMDYWVNHVKAARNATEHYGGVLENDSMDLHHFAENLAGIVPNATIDAMAGEIMAGVEAAVLNETHGTNPSNTLVPVNHTNGLTTHFQPPSDAFNPAYLSSSLAFVGATSWDEFLAEYDVDWRIGYPTVMNFGPVGTDVPVDTLIELWFSEPVDPLSLVGSVDIQPTPTPLPGDITVSGAYYSYARGFDPGTTYTITVTTNVTDTDGSHVRRNFTWQFTTAAEPIPEFPGALLPVFALLAVVLGAAWRRGSGKAFRK